MKLRFHLLTLLFSMFTVATTAQQTRSLTPLVGSVRVVTGDDPLLPPVVRVGGHVDISFDLLAHARTRYIYKVEFCNADWTPATEVFESDWLEGFNERPIEDYETSLNTTVLYTHFRLSFPNEDTRLLLPGNYRVRVFDEDDEDESAPLLEACWMQVATSMAVSAEVSSNTDIDVNQHHQQVTFALSYNGERVVDPMRELHTVVVQNRRWENAVIDLSPNIVKANGAEWTYRRELIFPAGNEFHKFEILDVRQNGMNVDRMEWFDPNYHATLFPVRPARNYAYDEDVNGNYVIRRHGDEDNDMQCDYLFVHFLLQSPRLAGGDVYVSGLWTNGMPDERCRMSYDESRGCYETGVLLKQGYYNYQFVQLSDDGHSHTARTEGDFYQTENEYIILVYHRAQGARYDRLVAYQRLCTNASH